MMIGTPRTLSIEFLSVAFVAVMLHVKRRVRGMMFDSVLTCSWMAAIPMDVLGRVLIIASIMVRVTDNLRTRSNYPVGGS